jgi:hypothetical protein
MYILAIIATSTLLDYVIGVYFVNTVLSFFLEHQALASHWLDKFANSTLEYLATGQSCTALD